MAKQASTGGEDAPVAIPDDEGKRQTRNKKKDHTAVGG